MNRVLEALAACQFFNALDLNFARVLAELQPESPDGVVLAAALTSRQTRAGHVCLRLDDFAGEPFADAEGKQIGGRFPGLQPWLADLRGSSLVGDAGAFRPLILIQQRLYLQRYWQHETRLAELLLARVLRPAALGTHGASHTLELRQKSLTDEPLSRAVLRDGLARLFAESPNAALAARTDAHTDATRGVDWQRVAVQLALTQRLCIISGGPGTGKTSSVVRLLALLAEQARSLGRRMPSVALMAPTGKAAARLVESIKRAKSELRADAEIRDAIIEEASTIHRALRALPGASQRFLHDETRPLLADVVIVDEASMVDVALMRRLVQAVSPDARLILLGDADQLASVEAGAVLGDICSGADNRYSPALAERLFELSAERVPVRQKSVASATSAEGVSGVQTAELSVGDCVVRLEHSYRFRNDGGIGALARAIKNGDERAVASELSSSNNSEVALVPRAEEALGAGLTRWVIENYASYLESTEASAALEGFGRVRVLCAHRRGYAGVEHLNLLIESALADAHLINPKQHWYPGRPLLITKNDYQLQLFNGDVGIVLRQASERSSALAPQLTDDAALGHPNRHDGTLRVVFAGSDAALRAISPARLPGHETAFAMSIHKSQGSEFNEVAVVLPEPSSPLLSRELLYTAVTRARRRVVIFGTLDSVLACVRQPVRRASGLTEALQG